MECISDSRRNRDTGTESLFEEGDIMMLVVVDIGAWDEKLKIIVLLVNKKVCEITLNPKKKERENSSPAKG